MINQQKHESCDRWACGTQKSGMKRVPGQRQTTMSHSHKTKINHIINKVYVPLCIYRAERTCTQGDTNPVDLEARIFFFVFNFEHSRVNPHRRYYNTSEGQTTELAKVYKMNRHERAQTSSVNNLSQDFGVFNAISIISETGAPAVTPRALGSTVKCKVTTSLCMSSL